VPPRADRGNPLRGEPRRRLAQALADRFQRGDASIQQLATEYGRRPSTIRRLLQEAGVTMDDGPMVGVPVNRLASTLASRYRNGASIAALVRQTGIDRRAIRALLISAGISLPERGTRPDDMADMLALRYHEGASIRDLADLAGCSYSTIRTLLLDSGVTLRTQRGTET
jgi:lambda repressor-like predicted transcriptional regulator